MPKRPEGEICGIAVNPLSCACVDSETGKPTSVRPIDKTPNGCGGYIAISPQYYNQIEDWIQEIIKRVRGFPKSKQIVREQLQHFHDNVESAKNFAVP